MYSYIVSAFLINELTPDECCFPIIDSFVRLSLAFMRVRVCFKQFVSTASLRTLQTRIAVNDPYDIWRVER